MSYVSNDDVWKRIRTGLFDLIFDLTLCDTTRPGLLEFFSDRGFRFSRGSRGLDWIERVLDFWIGLKLWKWWGRGHRSGYVFRGFSGLSGLSGLSGFSGFSGLSGLRRPVRSLTSVVCFIFLFLPVVVSSTRKRMEAMVVEFDTFDFGESAPHDRGEYPSFYLLFCGGRM